MSIRDYNRRELGLANTGSFKNPQTSDHFAKKAIAKNQRLTNPVPIQGAANHFGARELWELRTDYMENAPRKALVSGSLEPLSMIDFWYDKQMYGKVDMEQNPVYLSEAYLAGLGNIHMAIEPVVMAFNDFADRWNYLGMQKKIQTERTVYKPGNLDVTKGWVSVHPLYHEHMIEIFSDFQTWIMLEGRRKKIMTFKSFLQHMLYFIDTEAPMRPFSRGGFILSRHCDRAISGLQIEIGDSLDGDDRGKKVLYQADANYDAFCKVSAEYGFMVDFNAPNRIVANIESDVMRRYINDYVGVQTNDELFKTAYYRADSTDIDALCNYLCSFWNDFVRAFPMQTSVVSYAEGDPYSTNDTKTNTAWRQSLKFDATAPSQYNDLGEYIPTNNHKGNGYSSKDLFTLNFGPGFSKSLYLFVRAREAALDWNQKIFEREVKRVSEVSRYLDNKRAMDYIHRLTERLPYPGGNPPYRTEYNSLTDKEYYATMESTKAGNSRFMLTI